MPNWCHNRVTFTGTTEEINNIIEFVAGDTLEEPFSLNAIIPMPQESKEDWYNWSNENWGTKWDVTEVEISDDHEDGVVTYSFETAWGPPEPIFNMLCGKYPEVHISWFYDEPGMEFSGYLPD